MQFMCSYFFDNILQNLSGTCGWNKFLCSNLQCLALTLTCDGANNCGDGSDENTTLCALSGNNIVNVKLI